MCQLRRVNFSGQYKLAALPIYFQESFLSCSDNVQSCPHRKRSKADMWGAVKGWCWNTQALEWPRVQGGWQMGGGRAASTAVPRSRDRWESVSLYHWQLEALRSVVIRVPPGRPSIKQSMQGRGSGPSSLSQKRQQWPMNSDPPPSPLPLSSQTPNPILFPTPCIYSYAVAVATATLDPTFRAPTSVRN